MQKNRNRPAADIFLKLRGLLRRIIPALGLLAYIHAPVGVALAETPAPGTNSVAINFDSAGRMQLITTAAGQRKAVIAQAADKLQQIVATNDAHTVNLVWQPRDGTLRGSWEALAGELNEVRLSAQEANLPGRLRTAALTMVNGYTLEIAPGEGLVARPDDAYSHANTPGAPMTILYAPESDAHGLRLHFVSGSSGKISWHLRFETLPQPGAETHPAEARKTHTPDLQ